MRRIFRIKIEEEQKDFDEMDKNIPLDGCILLRNYTRGCYDLILNYFLSKNCQKYFKDNKESSQNPWIIESLCSKTRARKEGNIHNHYNFMSLNVQEAAKEIVEKGIEVVRVLGSGTFGHVFEAIMRGHRVAIKAVSSKKLSNSSKLRELFNGEREALEKIKSIHVISLAATFETNSCDCIAMEFCNGGTLKGYLQQRGRLQEQECLIFMIQLLQGLSDMHKCRVMHRDFKAENILLHYPKDKNQSVILKICDLGFAKALKDSGVAETILGTPATKAPEVMEGKLYGFEADLFSLGVVAFEMLLGRPPFPGNTEAEILYRIKEQRLSFDLDYDEKSENDSNIPHESLYSKDQSSLENQKNHSPNKSSLSSFRKSQNYFSERISDDWQDLLIRMMSYKRKTRISWDEVINHRVFQKYLGKQKNSNREQDGTKNISNGKLDIEEDCCVDSVGCNLQDMSKICYDNNTEIEELQEGLGDLPEYIQLSKKFPQYNFLSFEAEGKYKVLFGKERYQGGMRIEARCLKGDYFQKQRISQEPLMVENTLKFMSSARMPNTLIKVSAFIQAKTSIALLTESAKPTFLPLSELNLNQEYLVVTSEIIQEAYVLLYCLLDGLYWLHQNNIIHRNISPNSVFVIDNVAVESTRLQQFLRSESLRKDENSDEQQQQNSLNNQQTQEQLDPKNASQPGYPTVTFKTSKKTFKLGGYTQLHRFNNGTSQTELYVLSHYKSQQLDSFLAPEIQQNLPHSFASDIFSIGAVLFYFVYGKAPFRSQKPNKDVQQVRPQESDFFEQIKSRNYSMKIDCDSPQETELFNLIERMISFEEEQRVSFAELWGNSNFNVHKQMGIISRKRQTFYETNFSQPGFVKQHLSKESFKQLQLNDCMFTQLNALAPAPLIKKSTTTEITKNENKPSQLSRRATEISQQKVTWHRPGEIIHSNGEKFNYQSKTEQRLAFHASAKVTKGMQRFIARGMGWISGDKMKLNVLNWKDKKDQEIIGEFERYKKIIEAQVEFLKKELRFEECIEMQKQLKEASELKIKMENVTTRQEKSKYQKDLSELIINKIKQI